jgi:cardiolipin synthase (CMP-forming)
VKEGGRRTELRPWTLPNFITFARLLVLPFLIVAMLQGRHGTALAVFLAAALTDIADGYLARHFGMSSPLGAYLDPIADKLFLVSAFIVYALPSTPTAVHVPIWLLVVMIFRDVSMPIVGLVMILTLDIRHFPPSALGKATTFLEVSTVTAILLTNIGRMPPIVAEVLFRLVLAGVIASGLHYTWLASNRLKPDGERAAKEEPRPR